MARVMNLKNKQGLVMIGRLLVAGLALLQPSNTVDTGRYDSFIEELDRGEYN